MATSGPDAGPAVDQRAGQDGSTAEDVLDEVLVEEVSIDGMCGVY